jgi:predicted small lipoprotein YifL
MRFADKLTLVLVIGLGGCATSTPLRLPPADLLQDCGSTLTKPRTNGELVRQREALIVDIAACNRDKALLREWAKGAK